MAVVSSMTLARLLELEASTVVGGSIDGSGHLILVKHDGSTIDAGDALVAVPNESVVHFLNASDFDNSTLPIDYPDGISLMYVNATNATADWPTFAGKWGSIRTVNYPLGYSDADTHQMWTRLHGSSSSPEQWVRAGNGPDGWSTWKKVLTSDDILAPKIVSTISAPLETDGPSAYPLGVSLALVGSGSGWSLEAGFGSIMTIYQTTARLFQTFFSSGGGSSNGVRMYVRTYHDPEGWTPWQKMTNQNDPASIGMTGEIKLWPSSTIPNGWSLCDGGLLDRTTNAALFAVIGTTYGIGDGSTTFAKPDLKGRVPVGFDGSVSEFNVMGKTGGEKTHVLTSTEMPSHTHVQDAHGHSFPGANGALTDGNTGVNYGIQNGTFYGFKATNTNNTTATNQNTGGGGAHNNLQPYIALKYIIKL